MKILYVSAIELNVDGGPKTHIIEMIREMHNLGHEIFLLTPPFDRDRLSLPVKVLHYPFWGYSFVRRIISYFFLFVLLVWSISRFKPTIVYERQMEYNPFVYLVCRLLKLPFFVEINGLFIDDLKQTGAGHISIATHSVTERKEFHWATGILCTSPRLKEIITCGHEYLANKICFVPNGVNRDLFRPLDKLKCQNKIGLNPEMKYIGYVGTFNHLHNSEHVIEIFSRLSGKIPEAKLIMVGDGPRRKNCEMTVANLELSGKVIFTGLVRYEDVPVYINSFDIGIVLATKQRLEREGVVAFKLFELLSCGCPTIAHYKDHKDFEYFSPFVKMVHVDDQLGISKAIIEVLRNPDECAGMAEQALSFINKNISWEKSALITLDFITTITSS
jgi:glycosyltransferase involved in cell wall biosynthesis